MAADVSTKIVLFTSPDLADEFEALLKEKAKALTTSTGSSRIRVRKLDVQGQTIGPEIVDLIKVVVTLGGGAGIAAILRPIAQAIRDFMKARRGDIKLQGPGGEVISLKGYTADEVKDILSRLIKEQ